MAMDQWAPLREMQIMRNAMGRIFQEAFMRPAWVIMTGGRAGFPFDIVESDDRYIVRAALPGFRADDVHVSVQGSALQIRAMRKRDELGSGQRWVTHEMATGTFERYITLPTPVDANHAQARFEQGILVLSLPKAETAKPHHIPIGRQPGAYNSPAAAEPPNPPSQSLDDVERGVDDNVTLSSMESFPASDPPSWSPERS